MPRSRASLVPVAAVLLIAGWGLSSWATGGVVATLVASALDGGASIEQVRAALASAGVFAPVVYVAAVVIEVMVAPIPGLLLYLPGGALFGGFWGGTLALAGNVIGASLATWLARAAGERVARRIDMSRMRAHGERIRARGVLVVALLRVNPLTSSDIVSYAAGLAGVAVWRVALGTTLGMAPLCYAQSYAAEWIFQWLPGSGVVVLLLGVAYLAVVIGVVMRAAAASPTAES
jgi:uncharacterized membrane protein YdjX (TVP38/TMEM64 family)